MLSKEEISGSRGAKFVVFGELPQIELPTSTDLRHVLNCSALFEDEEHVAVFVGSLEP